MSKPFFLRTYRGYKFYVPYLWILPALIYTTIVTLIPAIMAAPYSFTNWSIISPNWQWVGFKNYIELWRDERFWQVFQNTLWIVLFSVPIKIILALLFALLLNQGIKGRVLWQIIYFLPGITSSVAVAIVWTWLYDPQFGPINGVLRALHLPESQWLHDPSTALMSVIILIIWQSIGYPILIFFSGLQGISQEYYEAASIDGANSWNRLRYITLPLLKPIFAYLFITAVAGTFHIFEQTYIMEGPLHSTETLMTYLYRSAFTSLKMGYAEAIAMILFIVNAILMLTQWKFFFKEVL
ncbi:MAG: carbohydrate ABC transporter permease [Dictyoglomaceae bacterium]